MSKITRAFLFISGGFLLGLNIIGTFLPLRHPDIYQLKPGDSILLTEAQFYERAPRKRDETSKTYATRLNHIVNNGIASYGNAVDQIHGQIPIYENYLLFFAGYVYPKLYRPYEFCNYQKAIKRGLGICSQQAIILTEILQKNNIRSHIVGLSGHVVTTVQVDPDNDTWWILDPYYDKVIPNSLTAIEQNTELVRPFYTKQSNEDSLISLYGAEGNQIYANTRAYTGWKKYSLEQLSYFFIWFIPISCIFYALYPRWSSNTSPSKYANTIR